MAQILELEKGGIYDFDLKETAIAFICKGKILLSYMGAMKRSVDRGHMMMLPPGDRLHVTALRDSYVFVIRLRLELKYCERLRFEELEKFAGGIEEEFNTLPITPPVKRYLGSFIPCVQDKLRCTHFLTMKINELMYLLRAYYTKEQSAAFFSPLLGRDNAFRLFIYKNASVCGNVGELASKANMSMDGFLRKFKRVMNTTPANFIAGVKANKVRYAILCTDIPMKEICDDHGFATAAGFVKFCKKHYGITPARMRSRDKKNAHSQEMLI